MTDKYDQSSTIPSKFHIPAMMQTASFFSTDQPPFQSHDKQDLCKADLEVGNQQYLDKIEGTKKSRVDSNVKKQTNLNNNKLFSQQNKCLTSIDDLSHNQPQKIEQILIKQTNLVREYSAPLKNTDSSKLNFYPQAQGMNIAENKMRDREQLIGKVQMKESIVKEVKKRGLSLACEMAQNERKDEQFWDKINHIVQKNEQGNDKQNKIKLNGCSNQYYSMKSTSKHHSSLPAFTPQNFPHTSTSTFQHLSQKSQHSIKDPISIIPNYNSNKQQSSNDIYIHNSLPQQLFPNPYPSVNTFRTQSQLPQLNEAYQSLQHNQQRRIHTNSSQDNIYKDTKPNFYQRNFWSSQTEMRQELQTLQRENQFYKMSDFNQSRFPNVISTSPPLFFQSEPIEAQNSFHQNLQRLSSHHFTPTNNTVKSPSNQNLGKKTNSVKQMEINFQRKENNFVKEQNIIKELLGQVSTQNYWSEESIQFQKPLFSTQTPSSTHLIDLINQNPIKKQNDDSEKKIEIKNNGKFNINQNTMTQISPPLIAKQSRSEHFNKENQISITQLKQNSSNLSKQQKEQTNKSNKTSKEKQQIFLADSKKSGQKSNQSSQIDKQAEKLNQMTRLQLSSMKDIKKVHQTQQISQQEFSFCFDQNQGLQNEQNSIPPDHKNILFQLNNTCKNNISAHQDSFKKSIGQQFQLSATIQNGNNNSNKFNLKCKQQQNVVKKIFNFDQFEQGSRIKQNTSQEMNSYYRNINQNSNQYDFHSTQLYNQPIYTPEIFNN